MRLTTAVGIGTLCAVMTPAAGHAIPAWARRYNVNCSHCHAPAVPRLNALGMRFRWAGYRMPEEIGTAVSVEQIQNYIALRGRTQYVYQKTDGQPASKSAFEFSDATFFFSGPFGKNYGAFFELEREPEGEVGLQAHVESAWGKEKSYGGFRIGLMHWLLRDGVAGFDRPTGLRTPLPLANPLTSAIPFRFSKDQFGIEAYYVAGRNRLSAEILNGINRAGAGNQADPDTKKDVVLTDQLIFDEAGSGLTAVAYYGSLRGADPAAPSVTSHFWRLAFSANKIIHGFEALGGVAVGRDEDLPVLTGGSFTAEHVKAVGYWGYAGYTIRPTGAPNPLTVYGRYEYLDPNTDLSGNARRRYVLGGVLPVVTPEYLRLALEWALDDPQGSGPKTNGLTAEIMLNF